MAPGGRKLVKLLGMGGIIDEQERRMECLKAHQRLNSPLGMFSPFNPLNPMRAGHFHCPSHVNRPRHQPWFNEFGPPIPRCQLPWHYPQPPFHRVPIPVHLGRGGGYRGGRRRPREPRYPQIRSGVVHPIRRRRRRSRFEEADIFDDLSDDDIDDIEDLLSESDYSDDSEDAFSESSPRSFVRRDPWRHRPRRHDGLLRDGGFGIQGPRDRGGREFGGFGGGRDRVPGMLGRDRYRTGHWAGSSHDTMDSMYSDGETF